MQVFKNYNLDFCITLKKMFIRKDLSGQVF